MRGPNHRGRGAFIVNVWICIAYDPLPGIDRTTRLLRYGSLAEKLADSGHQVVLWTSTFDHWRKIQRFDADRTVALGGSLRIELLHAPSYLRNVSLARIRHNRVLAQRFLEQAQTSPLPDVVFAGIPCLELTAAAALFARKHGIPLNVDVQDIWPEVYTSVLPRLLRPVARALLWREFSRARRVFQSAATLTAVSKQYLDWARRIRRIPGRGDRVFHLGYRLPDQTLLEAARKRVPEFMARFQLEENRLLLTFLGQFGASYDLDTVVRAAEMISREPLPVRFVLAGAGDKLERVRRKARRLRSVTLTGWLEYMDTIALLHRSDVGLAAYSSRAMQSLPYKPFEYMAFGLPVISSLRGEMRDLVERCGIGLAYRPGDPRSLAEAVRALSDRARREAAGQASRRLFDARFDAEKITLHLVDHLAKLANVNR